MSHLMGSLLGFLSEAGRDEPFDESSARIFCGVNPALCNSEPFDELSARIFVPGYSGTMNPADPDIPKTLQATTLQLNLTAQ